MDCDKVKEILFLFFDNEMEDDLRETFESHLSRCPGCAHQLDYTRRLLIIFRQRCIRQTAPQRLRVKILTSLPHRKSWS